MPKLFGKFGLDDNRQVVGGASLNIAATDPSTVVKLAAVDNRMTVIGDGANRLVQHLIEGLKVLPIPHELSHAVGPEIDRFPVYQDLSVLQSGGVAVFQLRFQGFVSIAAGLKGVPTGRVGRQEGQFLLHRNLSPGCREACATSQPRSVQVCAWPAAVVRRSLA